MLSTLLFLKVHSEKIGTVDGGYTNNCVNCIRVGYNFCTKELFQIDDYRGYCCRNLYEEGDYCMNSYEYCTSAYQDIGLKYVTCMNDNYCTNICIYYYTD